MHEENIIYDKEDLRVIVDNRKIDINVLDYITIKEKYDIYLRTIRYIDNFISFEHLQSMFKDKVSKTKLFNDLNALCELSCIRKIFIGRHSYYILTRKAKTYLNKKNEKSYIEDPSNKKLLKNLVILDHMIGEGLNGENLKKYKGYEDLDYIYFNGQILINLDFYIYNEIMNSFLYDYLNGMESYFIDKKSKNIQQQIDLLIESKGDILSDLNRRNYYINKIYKGDNKLLLDIFFVDDENIRPSKYLNVLYKIENALKQIYFKPEIQALKYNFKIITKDEVRKNYIENNLKRLLEERLIHMENVFYKNSVLDLWKEDKPRILKEHSVSLLYNEGEYLWAINCIEVVTYNTNRFFYTANDYVKSIKESELNIISL